MQFFYTIFLSFFLTTYLSAQAEERLIIIGNKTGLTELTIKDARDIFKGKMSFWKNNEEVIVVLPSPKSDDASGVAKEIFQSSVTAMQKHWLALVFQGRANPPVFVQSTKEAIDYVNKNPGSIAALYCKSSEVPTSITIKLKY
jgi:ABC-type phosphate transport system substrate-binding protein